MHTRAHNLCGADVFDWASECVSVHERHYYSYFFFSHLLKANTCQWTMVIKLYVCEWLYALCKLFHSLNAVLILLVFIFSILAFSQTFHVIEQWVFDCRTDTYRSTASQCMRLRVESDIDGRYTGVHMNCIKLAVLHVPHSNEWINKSTKWTVNRSFVLYLKKSADWSVKKHFD